MSAARNVPALMGLLLATGLAGGLPAQPAYEDLAAGPALEASDPAAPIEAAAPAEAAPAAAAPAPAADPLDADLDRAVELYRTIWLGADRQTRDMRFWRIFHYRDTRRYEEATRAARELKDLLTRIRAALDAETRAVEALRAGPDTLRRYALLARRVTLFDTVTLWSASRVLHYDTAAPFDQRRDRTLDQDSVAELSFPGYYGTSWYSPSAWFGSRVRLTVRMPSAEAVTLAGAEISRAEELLGHAEDLKKLLLDKRTNPRDMDVSDFGGWILMQYRDLRVFEADVKPATLDLGLTLARAKAHMNAAAILMDGVSEAGQVLPFRARWTPLVDRWVAVSRWAGARNILSDAWNRTRRDFRIFEDTSFVSRHVVGTGGPASRILEERMKKD